jgi:hypothetical protein
MGGIMTCRNWKHNTRNSKNRMKNKRKRRRIKCRRGTRRKYIGRTD